jgi:basic amino acid/polyamine antiporter, APA family
VLYGNGNHSGRQHLRPDRRRGWPCRGLRPAVMALTVASYAELSTRFPVSAGEAAYVGAAFRSRALATAIGLLTVVTGVVSSAAVTLGSAGYIQQFIDLPQGLIVVTVTVLLAAVAAWGILESVVLASLFTLIEVGGLVTVIFAGLHANLPIVATIIRLPPLNAMALSGIGFGSLLAFFAFIGVEDLANVVGEAKVPHRDIPRAMVLTGQRLGHPYRDSRLVLSTTSGRR